MSLSVIWCENDDGLRIADSLGDEVQAYFRRDADELLNHRAFGASFSVECRIVAEFEHLNRDFSSFLYNPYFLPLEDVIKILTLRRRVVDAATEKFSQRLEQAIEEALRPTRLSVWSSALVKETLFSPTWDLVQPIMIHYLNYVLERFDHEERLDPNFYFEGLQGFEHYLLSSCTGLTKQAT